MVFLNYSSYFIYLFLVNVIRYCFYSTYATARGLSVKLFVQDGTDHLSAPHVAGKTITSSVSKQGETAPSQHHPSLDFWIFWICSYFLSSISRFLDFLDLFIFFIIHL